MPPLALAIDQGTHATRVMLVDLDGRIRHSAFVEIGMQRRGIHRVEQDPEEILASLKTAIEKNLAHSGGAENIVCAGLAVQRSSAMAWDTRSGRPLTPLISWQDRRSARWIQRLSSNAETVYQRTGLPLSAHYGGAKLRWLITHHPETRKARDGGYLAWGPLSAFLLWHLLETPVYAVDHVNAQRTQLLHLTERRWDPEMAALFELPLASLPAPRPAGDHYGRLKFAGIPLTVVTGDQAASFFSLGRPRSRSALVNLGTGAFVMAPPDKTPSPCPGLLTSIVHSTGKEAWYTTEGTVNGAGAALRWAADLWQIPDLVWRLPRWLETETSPPIFRNTIGGLGSPWWHPARLPGFEGTGSIPQRAVAVVESIAFLIQANIDAMADSGHCIDRIQVGGGLSRMDGMCQNIADLSQKPVYRPSAPEATIRGVAWLAFQRPKRWPRPGRGRLFSPRDNPFLLQRYRRLRRILEQPGGDD